MTARPEIKAIALGAFVIAMFFFAICSVAYGWTISPP